MQEQGGVGRQRHGPRDGLDLRELLVVELREQVGGVQVGRVRSSVIMRESIAVGRGLAELAADASRSDAGSPASTTIADAALQRALVLADAAADAAARDHLGPREVAPAAVGARTTIAARLRTIAFSGTGHISSQTMHGVPAAQGRQRSRSMHGDADHLRRACRSRRSGGIAPDGQTWPQALQA